MISENIQIEVSLIIPVYNNLKLALANKEKLTNYLSLNFKSYEVIFIDDGSNQSQNLNGNLDDNCVSVLSNKKNQGKGYSVKKGMLAARGNYCIFTDVDLPYSLDFIKESINIFKKNKINAVMGDRFHKLSESKVKISKKRNIISNLFTNLTQIILVYKVNDSQCGFKAFNKKLVNEIFPHLTTSRFAFDLEIYYVLQKLSIPYATHPVIFINNNSSSIRIFRDCIITGIETILIPIKWRLGFYKELRKKKIYKNT